MGDAWPVVAVKAGIVLVLAAVAGLTVVDLATDRDLLSPELRCEAGGGAWNDSNGSCAMPEDLNTVPDCSNVELPGPSILWCPLPLGVIAAVAIPLGLLGGVLSIATDRDGSGES